jgi:hypothetical protein
MALYYWVGGTNTWNSTPGGNKWATSSGGTTYINATVPGVGDDVIFDSFSTAGTVVTFSSAATVGTITFATFPGTFTFAANLSSGNTTLGASTTYTASGGNPTTYTFTARNVNSTFTANGKTLPTNIFINLGTGTTLTFAGNADFGGNLSTASITHTIKAATGTTVDLKIGGNISIGAMATNPTDHVTIKGYGTSKTFFSGGGQNSNMRVSFVNGSTYTASASSGTGVGQSFLTVETGGQFTVPNNTHNFSSTGTVTLSGFNTNSYFFALNGQGTYILSNDTVIKSFITIISQNMTVTSTGGARLLLEGNFTSSGTGPVFIQTLEFSGSTASIVTASMLSGSNLQVQSLTINKSAGGSVFFNTNGNFTLFIPAGAPYSWTHTAGTVTQGSSCIIRIWGNAPTSIFNYSAPSTSQFTFRDIEFYGSGTINLNTKLNATKISITPAINTISISSSGSFGFDTDSLFVINPTTTSKTVTLKSTVTYNISALLIMINAQGSILALNASTPGTKAKFYLGLSAIHEVVSVNPTDIDSHGNNNIGPPVYQTIYSQNGVITSSTWNWSVGNQPPPIAAKVTVGYTFVN